jgi:trehalose synthase-fused probable maltokinase
MREEGERRHEDGALVDFLKTRRWFGEKGSEIRSAELTDVIPVAWPNSQKQFAVARARVVTELGPSTYQLFLPRAEPPDAGPTRKPSAEFDALEDAEFLRGLADAWVTGGRFEHGRIAWIVESHTKTPLVVPPHAAVTLSGAEQTNSSVILNREAILKLYRRLEPGVHPDVEVTRFLTIERLFVHVPVLMGTIRFEDAQGTTIAGMLQEYVQGATDGWSHVLECLKSNTSFESEAEQLGVVTRSLHEHLASGDSGSDFDLRAASADDVRRWKQSADATIARASRALERALRDKALPRQHAEAARAAAERVTGAERWLNESTERLGDDFGGNTRTHGDYHLGQVLRAATRQFLVIDFEGEPTRPLQDRRARSSPLRDVAGMLRSFSYAAAVGACPEGWEDRVRASFLRGYFTESSGMPGLLPRRRDNADRLIALFEAEKVFYELHYEIDHRPDWVWIPLLGITQLLA